MSTPPIQRYDMYLDGAGVRVGKSKEGEYVTHEDHHAAFAAMTARAERAEESLMHYHNLAQWQSPTKDTQ